MAQFVTHIQPTLVEASFHHIPHPHHHKEHHEKHDKFEKHDKHDKHHKEGSEGGKDKHGSKINLLKLGQHYPVLPATPSHSHHEEHGDYEHKRDSGHYLDSHGIPHTYQLHFIDSQGIHRDFHGHVEDYHEREHHQEYHQEKEYCHDKERHWEKRESHVEMEEVIIRKAVPEDRSPFEKSPSRDEKRPIPPQFINLHTVHGTENKYQTSDGNTSFLRAARNGQLDKVLEHLKSNIDINTSNANGLNALHLASKDGHVEIVKELLKRGALVDAATKKGNTALHIASLAGQEEVVKLLVQNGSSVNVQSQNGFTPLYMAAQENHDNVVKYLLANGANQSLSTEDGFTPLAVAMQQGHDKVVTVLLENDTRGKVRLPALHIAAKKDDVKAAKLLLENEHNPDVTSKSGFTPLHIASHYGNQQIANLLIQKGADVNYAAKHNITPLHVAAKWGKTNMVALLLENGAAIEAKTRDGLTPLHCAARSGHEQVVDMLLEKGAPISSKTKNGLAPLHMAAQGDHVDAARILLYHRAPVDEVTVDYLTALHVAAHCGHVRVAKLLLDRQADANARALNGFTPLHIACKKNRIKVVELLLKHGASIGATTESGLTPLHVASFMGCMNIVIYLLQHDANPDAPTIRGETPLHLAARANQTDIIRILLRNGAQVDARAREQQTPLHIASRLGNVDIVMLLLQHGSKVDNTTKDMYTALHIAAKEGQDEVTGVLIDNGASINATTKKGFTPLHLASKYGNLKVAKLLLQKEAPVDAQGKNGVTPLHVASHYDHQNVALLLLDKGASPHAIAKNGHTPLHIAARKNQMDIANTLLEYGAQPNAESKAGFTPLHLSAQEGHVDMTSLLLEHKADPNHEAKNGLAPLHLCAQEDRVPVADVLVKNGAHVDAATKAGYTPLHIACHYGQTNMVRFLLRNRAEVQSSTSLGYTPLHQAAQQGHTNIVNILLENKADPNAVTTNGQTPLNIAQKLGYITVIETLKVVTTVTNITTTTTTTIEEKYRVQAPEAMQETFMSDSEEEGGEDTALGDQTYRYLTADEMKSLGDDSLPIDVTRDERIDSNKMINSIDSNMLPPQHIEDAISPEHVSRNYTEYIKKYIPDNVDINRHPINIGFLVSFLVDARGGAMRGCRHSGVRVIVPPRCAPSPTRITCRYVRPQRTPHPPPLMEGEALASRVLELGPVGAKFLGPVIIEVPHFAALRGKEREIVILRSDNGESWKEHTVDATEEILNEVLHESFEAEDLNQMEDISSGRITRIVTQDFPQYFAVVSRIRQEVHAIGPEGGMVSSTVVPQVQAIFPEGALTKKIKVGLQAQPIDPELTAKLLGHGVAVSPVVTVEPRRRKFHKAIRLNMPAPTAHSQGMINQYSGSAPTLRLLCSITGGTTRAQWEDVTGSTPLTFVNDVVSFTTTVSARFWLMDCRNIGDATKMATELYKEAIHVPFMAKFVVFAKRVDPLEARLRVFCMTDDKEDKTLEHQEHFTEVAKSRDVEVLEGKPQYIEFAGNLVPITKSGEQLQFSFRAFRENRLPFSVRVKDQHAEAVGRCLFMREAKIPKGEPPQQPICILNIVLPDDIVTDTISLTDSESGKRHMYLSEFQDYYRPDPRLADMSNLLGEDWVELAHQLGLTSSEINVIKSEYPESIAKQAQSMLRMWLSQSGNKAQTNTLENALRRIGREDIIPQCLNVEHPTHTFTRIKEEEVGYRLRRKEEGEVPDKKKMIEHYDKYSAEEKFVEKSESEEEDNFDKTVTERREQIQKRLSAERAIPASSQRREIVQEISDIKRQSIVEDKIAEVKQKVEPDTKTKPDVKTQITETVEIKTTLPSDSIVSEKVSPEKPEVTTTKIVETHKIIEETVTHRPGEDMRFMEEVSSRFEEPTKVEHRILSSDDPKSPNFSKTPPPSPADFLLQKQAASAQEWEAPRKPADVTGEASLEKDAAQQEISCGLTPAEPSLTSTDPSAPQPKPRTTKPDMPLDFSKILPKTDKIMSPVRDDLLDNDEDDFATYSDRKKFWENVSKETAHKRMSLHEVTSSGKEIISKKRTSIHEIGLPPIPKPRSILQTSQSLIETESANDIIQEDICKESTLVKEKTVAELKIEKAIEAEKIHAQEELTSIIEGIESTDKEEKIMTEYQASFMPPSDRKDAFAISDKSQHSSESQIEKEDSLDSDKAQKGSSQLIENTGYISDSEDVENVISDSEIEDRVPQIRERQMSVFAPPVTQRKTIYERSASLPTEDLYEVSRNLKHLKEKYEQKIKEDMIEEQFVTDNEEECSPERKTLTMLQEERINAVKSYVDESISKITEEESEFEEISETSFTPIRRNIEEKLRGVKEMQTEFGPSPKESEPPKLDKTIVLDKLKDDVNIIDTQESYTTEIVKDHDDGKHKQSVKDLAKTFEKQISSEATGSKTSFSKATEELFTARSILTEDTISDFDVDRKVEHDVAVASTIPKTHKETESDIQHKAFESELSSSPDRNIDLFEEQKYRDDSRISKDSMEVHVDKSEIEDSEKIAEVEQETDFESKSFDSVTAEQSSRPASEDIPEITVTLSGKQRRISEESDEYSEKIELPATVSPILEHAEQAREEEKASIKQSEEHIQNTLWEATVETQSDFDEKVDMLFGIKEQMKLTEEFIATEKILEEKEQIMMQISERDAKGDITDFDEMPSVEEDEFSQVEHIVKRQSISDFEKFEQQFIDGELKREYVAETDQLASKSDDEISPVIKDTAKPEASSIKENISEKLTKEIHEKLNEKLKTQDIMIEKAISEEVDDKTLDELKELMVEEALEELQQKKPAEVGKKGDIIHEKDDDLSSGLREESELGSEVHMDHSDSITSDRIKSESHSEIEKIILDTFQHMKVDPEEAKRMASQLIEEIENEIQNRGELTKSEATEQSLMFDPEMSSYIKQLAETNGLDEREVELVESVLARRQRELAKLARGDTQASSMEITDEDLRYSGGELADYTHTLEQQMGQLEAEKVHDLVLEYDLLGHEKDFHEKSETFDKIDEKHRTEKVFSEDSETYDESKIKITKKDIAFSIADSVKGEKSYAEHKNVILEEDETISESSVEEHSKIKTHIDSEVSETALTKTDDSEIQEIKSGVVTSESSHKSDVESEHREVKSEKIEEEHMTETTDDHEITQVRGKYTADHISKEVTDEFLKELKLSTEKQYDESVQIDEKRHKEELNKYEKQDDGTEISTTIMVEKQHFASSSEVVTKDTSNEKVVIISSKTVEGTDLSKLLEDDVQADNDTIITKTETIHRTSSSDSKSSLDSGKSPDKKFEGFGKEHVVLRKTKREVDSSSSSSNLKPDRRSGVEFDAYSSSGESHYQSFEMDSGKSRPCSSDVEGIVAAASSEYETALTSTQEYSGKSHVTSTDYHTAISSLSSKESMKSLDSESSGNLASVEVSEHSETLVPSTSDLDGDILDSIDQQILEDAEPSSGWTGHGRPGRQISDLTDSDMVNESIDISEEEQNDMGGKSVDILSKMKRSAEMTFQPEPKVLAPESPHLETNDVDDKYGQGLDEGSILSMSVSSTSSTGAQRTVIEMSERHEGSMTVSGVSEHLSLEDNELTMRGSQESLPLTPTLQKSNDIATSTPQIHPELPIEHVTITTSSVKEDGIHSASTQITSENSDICEDISTGKIVLDEPRKKGHRRTESTMIGISLPTRTPDIKFKDTEKKEKEADESEKDIDEKEQSLKDELFDNEDVLDATNLSSKSDSEKDRLISDMIEPQLAELVMSSAVTEETEPIERPTSPELQDVNTYEPSELNITTIGDLELEYSPRTKGIAMELQRKRSTSSISETSKEILEKRDSHGKSSSTSSEKSSFEEAEAEAAFNMVAHISPAHKVKQIVPILEDEDAEKHELELREKQRKELEEKRAQMRDISPGFIPDITVTDMTPDSDHDSRDEEEKPISSADDNFDDSFEKITEESSAVQECIKQDLQKQTEESVSQDGIEDEILTSSMMQSTLIDSVVTESTASDIATVIDAGRSSENDQDSHSSDSFEMLEKPDIIDDFVVIEEVGKEAQEFDTEGQSVKIDTSGKKIKKHDEEIERYLAHSAPTPLTGTTGGSSADELGFEFEDSPPRPEGSSGVASTRDYGYEYDRELEANKKWIEQQFQGDQAAMLAAGYGYEMEFERGPLEDIKEEDINDFAASSYGSQKESGGSLGSVKGSYSSTPDYDVLAGRKYFTRSGEQDDISMNSLQEFENLEQAMSLEMRKFHQGQGSGSSSSGSSKTRLHHGKNNTGDDISVSSLKEFEGLEHACLQAHKIEIKAKEEEEMLAQIEEGQESIASESESCETAGTEKKLSDTEEEEDYEKRMFEIDEIIKQAQSNVERFIDLREVEKTESLGRGDSIEEVSKVPELELDTPVVKSTIKVQWKENEDVMITSTDSLDFKQEEERRDSTDSLDAQPVGDVMTASTDSIEFQAQRAKENIMTDSIEIRDEKSYMVSSDSLELGQATSSGLNVIQTDSIDEDGSRIGAHDHSSASTGKDFSSSAREEVLAEPDIEKEDIMLRSIESMDPTSSTATHATMQYDTDSVFSGSFTSGGSNTMVSSTDTIDPMHPKEMVDVGAAVRKVWFDEDFSGRRMTEYVEESSRPYISETIEPMDDEQFSHIIHRKVEMAPEVRKVTFTGPDAEEQLRKFMQDFNEGEDVQETQEVDEYGNIHTKRIIQKRFVVKGDEGEQPMTKDDIEDYFRQLNQPEVVQDRGVITRTVSEAVFTKEISDGKGNVQTTITKKFDVLPSELTSLTRTITGEEHLQSSDSQQGASSSKAETEEVQDKPEKDKSKKATDQHQLSQEMTELLKEMEKESKQ